ncbi:flavin reductase family protein [bacterium]|nr:flavin reductase family protein [bacterium]
MKRSLTPNQALQLINHGPTILVTAVGERGPNIITLAWSTPVSIRPPLLAISVAPSRYSHDLILNSGEFVVNVPNSSLLEQVHLCGTISGRNKDKFKEAGLTPIPANKVKAPLIKECIGHIECKLYAYYTAGDHTIFIAEVVGGSVDEELYDGHLMTDKVEGETLHHLGGNVYAIAGRRVRAR